MASGDEAGLGPEALEKRDCLTDAVRSLVFKWGWCLHETSSEIATHRRVAGVMVGCGSRHVNRGLRLRLGRVPEQGKAAYDRVVTLAQLKVFVLVARLGSVKAAATALGVSEPAVSQALAALRTHLGDPLLSKIGSGSGSGMELTEAGRRVVGIASQMVSLATEAESAVRHSHGAPELLRIVATSTIAESIAPALLQAFSARAGNVELTLGVSSTAEIEALLYERLVDVALGPKVVSSADVPLDSEALLRYRMVFVAGRRHPLAARTRISPSSLATDTWLVDPSGADPASDVGKIVARLGVPADRIQVFPNSAAAYMAAARGGGIAPAVDHLASAEISKGELVRLDVVDTPISLLWHVTSRADDRRPPMVSRFRRFLTTPDAMHAMHRMDGSVPASRFRPPVHVTIWS